MRKSNKVIGAIVILIILIFVIGYYSYSNSKAKFVERYNLIVINNTGDGISSVGHYDEYSSGAVCNADGSTIKAKEKFNLYMNSNMFTLDIVDEKGRKFKSEEFNLDFSDDKVYEISIEKDSLQKIKFILK